MNSQAMPCRLGLPRIAFVFACHSGSFHPLKRCYTSIRGNQGNEMEMNPLVNPPVCDLPCEGDDGSAAFGSVQVHFIAAEQRAARSETGFVVLKRGGEDPSCKRAHDGAHGATNAVFLGNKRALIVPAQIVTNLLRGKGKCARTRLESRSPASKSRCPP